jgi:hypothetical protein
VGYDARCLFDANADALPRLKPGDSSIDDQATARAYQCQRNELGMSRWREASVKNKDKY